MNQTFKYYRPATHSGPIVTPERARAIDDSLIAVLENGQSAAEAFKLYGVPPKQITNTICRLRKKGLAVPMRLAGRRPAERDRSLYEVNPATGRLALSDKTIAWLRELRAEGYSRAEISELTGVGTGIVAKYTEPAGEYRPDRADPTEPYGQPHA